MAKSKTKGEQLKEELTYEFKNGWDVINEAEKEQVHEISEDYKKFLDSSKTEREAVKTAVMLAEEKGFNNIEDYIKSGKKLKAGDKVYRTNREKNLILMVIGKKSIVEGLNITGSHIDCPRLDLKPNPLYEDSELAYFKTHYYGGIKKYQWVTIPLALHGVVVKSNGEKIQINIGEKG